jgi:hypothetical protein
VGVGAGEAAGAGTCKSGRKIERREGRVGRRRGQVGEDVDGQRKGRKREKETEKSSINLIPHPLNTIDAPVVEKRGQGLSDFWRFGLAPLNHSQFHIQ